jgi:hypothetical protein
MPPKAQKQKQHPKNKTKRKIISNPNPRGSRVMPKVVSRYGSYSGGLVPYTPRDPSEIEKINNTVKFAIAQSNPFRVSGPFPNAFRPVAQSHCSTGFIRGQATIGTNGVGWIAMNPVLSSDGICVYATTVTSTTSLAVAITSTDTGVVNFTPTSLPYAAAQFGAVKVIGRTCGAGFRVRYSGRQTNMAGSRWHIKNINGNVITGTNTPTSLISRMSGVRSFANDRRWSHCAFDFYDDAAATLGIADNEFTFSEVCIFTGVAGETVDFEAIMFNEYTGPTSSAIISGDLQRNRADADLAQRLIDTGIGENQYPESISTIERILRIYKQMISGRADGGKGKMDVSAVALSVTDMGT